MLNKLWGLFKLLFVSLLVLVIGGNSVAVALSSEQKRVIDSGAYYFNVEDTELCVVGGQINGEDNLTTIYNYLINKNVHGQPLQDFMVAGILANMAHESGFQPMRLQGTTSGVETPAESLSSAQLSDSRLGWGLVQWTPVTKVIDPLVAEGKDPNTIPNQLDFLLAQLNGETGSSESAAGADLVSSTNVAEATLSFETKYERHAGPPQPERIVEGEEILQRLRTQQTSNPSPNIAGGTVIALDPGHGGAVAEYVDEETGLRDRETPNSPEREDVLDVANRVKSQLQEAGYTVILLRESNEQAINKRERVNAAEAAGARMAISIHTTPGAINEVWPQHVGGYREKPNGERVEYNSQNVADESRLFAEAIAEARTQSEGHTVSVSTSTFQGGEHAPGNIPHVQLWSSIPWVYNEIGQNQGTGITDQRKQDYADGIVNGVKAAVPQNDSTDSQGCAAVQNGDVVSTALNYAWPDNRGSGYVELKPEYEAAMNAARRDGQYVGGRSYTGVDCGGFVTRVMIDSGFEPLYNYSGAISDGAGYTAIQLAWVRDNWTSIGTVESTSELQPGDVAFRVNPDGSNDGHTFMFVGDQPGFEEDIASASLDSRAPMAGRENPIASNIEWYRNN